MDQISKVKPNMGVGSTFFILAITWPNIFKWNQYYLVFDAPEIPYVCPWLRIKWSKFQTLEKKKTAVNNDVKSINYNNVIRNAEINGFDRIIHCSFIDFDFWN